MSHLTERAVGFRLAETFQGDTIQKIAMRELGDAARWTEIVAYNGLVAPYIVDSIQGIEESGDAGTVLIAGMHIKVPASRPNNNVSDPQDIYGTDVHLDRDGFLYPNEDGDLTLVRDVANLSQALRIRLGTELRELVWHPNYGNPLFLLKGQKANEATLQLGRAYGEQTLRADPRVDGVPSISSTIDGDAINVEAVATAIDGRSLPVRSDI